MTTATDARADLKLDGRWRQSALKEDFTVQQWLPACGEAPQSTATGGGEVVSIRAEGDELAFVGGGRVFRSNQCYDPMPTLSRETHSRDANGKTWRTRCTTPPNDPRKAILNTLVVATTDTRIDIVETGRYEIVRESGRCMADVRRTRSYDLIPDDKPAVTTSAAPTPAPQPTKEDPKPKVCATTGDPSRLEVRPSKKLLRVGETFQFKAVVLDDKGCATRTPTTWKMDANAVGKGVTVDANGSVTVAGDAPEGIVEIVATAAGKDTRVSVEVSSAAHYDELLARSGLNAAGENDAAAVATIASESIGAGEGKVEDRARERRMVFLAIVGGALVVLAAVAVVLIRRSRRAKALERDAERKHEARVAEVLDRRRRREAEHAAQQKAHEESLAAARASSQRKVAAEVKAPAREMICASCGREFPSPTAFCPNDGTALTPASKSMPRGGGVCPVCNRGFGPDVTSCPEDKEELIPYPVHAAIAAQEARGTPAKRGKICPTCGDRFDGGAEFCGKDGTQLVLLN
jgi:hypothetical protein